MGRTLFSCCGSSSFAGELHAQDLSFFLLWSLPAPPERDIFMILFLFLLWSLPAPTERDIFWMLPSGVETYMI